MVLPMEVVELGKKIAHGAWRDCYEIKGNPRECAKVIRKGRLKMLERFSSFDVNRLELEKLRRLPALILDHIPQGLRIAKLATGESVLVEERICDYDGRQSLTLEHAGRVSDVSFWNEFDLLLEEMKRSRMQFMDLHNPSNIVVQKVTPHRSRPVLIDLKYAGLSGKLLRRATLRVDRSDARSARLDEKYTALKKQYADASRVTHSAA